MEQAFVLALVVATSVGAYFLGVKGLGMTGTDLRSAIGRMLECVGVMVVFLVVNLAVGAAAVLAARAATKGFVSFYLVNDITLLILSIFQGLAFQCWWKPPAP
jgi:hypothetical protein